MEYNASQKVRTVPVEYLTPGKVSITLNLFMSDHILSRQVGEVLETSLCGTHAANAVSDIDTVLRDLTALRDAFNERVTNPGRYADEYDDGTYR